MFKQLCLTVLNVITGSADPRQSDALARQSASGGRTGETEEKFARQHHKMNVSIPSDQ